MPGVTGEAFLTPNVFGASFWGSFEGSNQIQIVEPAHLRLPRFEGVTEPCCSVEPYCFAVEPLDPRHCCSSAHKRCVIADLEALIEFEMRDEISI